MFALAFVCAVSLPHLASASSAMYSSEPGARAPGVTTMLEDALAAGDAADEAAWSFAAQPYLWAASFSGDAALGGGPGVSTDKGFSDIVEDIELGAMLGLEARAPGDRWGLLMDAVYIDLGGQAGSFDWGFQMLAVEFDVAAHVSEHVELLTGARYLGLDVDLDGGPGVRERQTKDLVDPVVGARGTWPLGEQLDIAVRGDVGGFGVGSEFSWQLAGVVRWHASEGVDIGLGWRHLEFEVDEDELELDLAFDGPVLGVTFRL